MSRTLRPRRHGPPSDHSYSACIPGVPVYDLQVTSIVTGLTLPSLDGGDFSEKRESTVAKCVESGEEFEDASKTKVVQCKVKSDKKPEHNSQSVTTMQKKRRRRRKAYYDFGIPAQKRRKCKPVVLPLPFSVTSPIPCTTTSSSQFDQKEQLTGDPKSPTSTPIKDGATETNILNLPTCINGVPPSPPKDKCVTSGFVAYEHLVVSPSDCLVFKETKKNSKTKGLCTCCSKQWGRKSSESHGDRRQSERIYMKNYKLPFSELPAECKLMILSYLSPCERAVTVTVCKEWEQLIKLSSMWSHVDLTIFNLAPLTQHRPVQPFNRQVTCKYNGQHERTVKYMEYLITLKPTMKSLKFKFDICSHREDWLNRMYELFDSSRKSGCSDVPTTGVTMLTKLTCDWTVTPMEPNTAQFCCIFNKIRTMFRRHLVRVKVFHEMLEKLTSIAPKLEYIQFPFDWSARSVLLLSRLKNIQVLKLGKYLNPYGLNQLHLDVLLKSLPQLKQLELAICIPVFSNKLLYKFAHPKLQVLDIVYCQGVFIQKLELPELVSLKLLRQYWRGSLVSASDNVIPCLYDVLCKGAPKMMRVNKHRLPSFWTEFLYDELDHLMYRVCSCKVHIYRSV